MPNLRSREIDAAENVTSANRQLLPKFTADQWVILSLSVAGLACSFLFYMRPDDQERVFIKGVDAPLPGVCASRQWLQLDCPGCGLTRSVVCISNGQLLRSIRFNVVGLVLYFYAAAYIVYSMLRAWIPVGHFLHSLGAWRLFVNVTWISLLVQWGVKLVF